MGLIKNSVITFGLLALAFLSGCKDENNGPGGKDHGPDRAKMLAFYADSIVIPSYDSFNLLLSDLNNKVNAFSSSPSEQGLTALRSAFENAYIRWQTVELFDFGPAELQTLRNFYNIYPADTAGIAGNIINASAGLEVPSSYPQQGFPALDYLINGVADNDASITAYYLNPDSGSKRCAYLKRISDRMNTLLQTVISDWKGGFRNTFVSKTGLDISASTSLMVNGIVLHYERFMRSGKIGIPSGVMLNGIPAPEKVEAFYKSDISRRLAQSAHKAYESFFNGISASSGSPGYGLKAYLNDLEAKDQGSGQMLSNLINTQLAQVDAGLSALLPDFHAQILADNEPMKQVYNQMQAAVRMLKVDMCSAMSITITFTDNDGD